MFKDSYFRGDYVQHLGWEGKEERAWERKTEEGEREREIPSFWQEIETVTSPEGQRHKPDDLDGRNSGRCLREAKPWHCCSPLGKYLSSSTGTTAEEMPILQGPCRFGKRGYHWQPLQTEYWKPSLFLGTMLPGKQLPAFLDYSRERKEPPLNTVTEFPASCKNRGLELDLIGFLKNLIFLKYPNLWSKIYVCTTKHFIKESNMTRVVLRKDNIWENFWHWWTFLQMGNQIFPESSKKETRGQREGTHRRQNMSLLEK